MRTRGRLTLLLLGALAAIVAWRVGSHVLGDDDAAAPAPPAGAMQPRTGDELGEILRDAHARSGAVPWWLRPARIDGAVTIAGTVIDVDSGDGVGGVEVVFRNEAGDERTTTGPHGAYWIDVPAGTYRAFVRGATVLEDSGDAPAPIVVADVDRAGVDLTVMRGGVLRGNVVDTAGRAVAKALVRARTDDDTGSSLGAEIVETEADGAFELPLPAGTYTFDVSHAEFVGTADDRAERTVSPGEIETATFTLVAGCVIAGRVVRADGTPIGDGAIERRSGAGGLSFFASVGGIAVDGSFRWTTTEETDVVLRAWPSRSQPSAPQSFACRDGARFEQVVFSLPDRGPDLDGELVDHAGAPVANAYVDVFGLNPTLDQRVRTDAQGRWRLFALPPGPYRLSAHAPGRGIASVKTTAPRVGLRIQLGGTGRIAGTARAIANGSFELELSACADGSAYSPLGDRRTVAVTDGRFIVEDVPACRLQIIASWRGHHARGELEVPSGGTGQIELPLAEGPLQLCLAR